MKIRFLEKISTNIKIITFTCVLAVTTLSASSLGYSQGAAPIVIRDTEIEGILSTWIDPLLKVSGLDSDSVNIVIVQSNQVNAFVAGGANLFLYSGLIEKTENPGELIGVMAHELGHIAGGHLIRTQAAIDRASYESILGMVLGIGAAVATGKGEAASAVMMGTNSMAERRFLAHSRVNESSADQAALSMMTQAGLNPTGLSTFLEKLGAQDLVPTNRQIEYARTHPLTENRIEALSKKIIDSPYKDKAFPSKWLSQHARMKAKFLGYTDPGRIQWIYDDRDTSIPAEYARAVALWRKNDIEQALLKMDSLIEKEPNNPYFHELSGQILVDAGRMSEALPFYRKAVEIQGDAPLIRIAYAHALLESDRDNEAVQKEAIDNLERAIIRETRSPSAHRFLATAYGRIGEETFAKYHLAEEAFLKRNIPYAKNQAEAVLQQSKEGSREWLKAKDLLQDIENVKDE